MRFIFTSQGTSGSGSLARSLNLIEKIFAVHGHFPIDKHLNLNYENEDLSHLMGHSMKGIYQKDLNTIFEFFEDCFPKKSFHGMVHTFTLDSLKNHISKDLKSLNDVNISNIVRHPDDVFLSSKSLIKKSLMYSRFGKREYLNFYDSLLKDNPLILQVINKIEFNQNINPFISIQVVLSAHTVATMFNEASLHKNKIKSYKIESILNTKNSFYEFLCESINFTGNQESITDEITYRVNMHRGSKSDRTISNLECVLIDYFLTSGGRLLMNSLYPNNCLSNSFFQDSKTTFDISNEQNYLMKNKILRDIRENLTITSLLNEEDDNLEFIKEKLSRTLDTVDKMLLYLKDDEIEIEPNKNQTNFAKFKCRIKLIFSKIKSKIKKYLN